MPNRTDPLLPVQPDGSLPLNFYDVEAPLPDRPEMYDAVVEKPITADRLRELTTILQDYKQGKVNLEQRIISNEQWWKVRNWEQFRRSKEKKTEIEPTSAFLFNALANKHADAMDNYPRPNILPREAGDKQEAQTLSSVVPVILDQCGFEQTYSDVWDYKLKSGTGVYAVLWNKDLNNGLGDIDIAKIDLLNMFWEPGISNIQDSPYLFVTSIFDNKFLESKYPELKDKLAGDNSVQPEKYIYDDTVDTTDKTVVIDCYYKTQIEGAEEGAPSTTVVHLVKYVGETILYSTENINRAEGIYAHGKYPFVFDPLFKTEGTPAGFGYIDIAKPTQEYIDRADKALLESLEISARPRVFVSNSAGINETEYADLSNMLVHVESITDDNFRIVQQPAVNSIYLQIKQMKIDELKEVTGNRDISTGGTTSGVTAASAIAAMQEAGSKLSRDMIKASFRAYREIILMVIELIRQFYDIPRQFRIAGANAAPTDYQFVDYDNSGLLPQPQGVEFGKDMGLRMPLFDIEITAEKASPYSRMARNELGLQFYSAGFFAHENSEQALSCMEMLDFDGKQEVMKRISASGTMYQMLMQRTQQAMMLAQMVGGQEGAMVAQQIANDTAMLGSIAPKFTPNAEPPQAAESSVTKNARQRVAESTSPT